MTEYLIRTATAEDIPFLIDVVVAASKSNSDKLGLSTLFNVPEVKVREIIGSMFEQDIDECEFSISSFLITEYHGTPVAAVGGWVEGLTQKIPSSTLKANLINFCFPKESIAFVLTTSRMISDILIERENLSLQIEYVYVDKNHRGKGLAEGLIRQHIAKALSACPELKKVQVQLFGNNTPAIRLYEKSGFHVEKIFTSNNARILDYLPHYQTVLMEIDITQEPLEHTSDIMKAGGQNNGKNRTSGKN